MNLLDEDIVAEITIVIPRQGPALFQASKQEDRSPEQIGRIVQEAISAVVGFAQAHGLQIGGTFGQGPPPGGA